MISWYDKSIYEYNDKPRDNSFPCKLMINGKIIVYLSYDYFLHFLGHVSSTPSRYSHKNFGLQIKSLRAQT